MDEKKSIKLGREEYQHRTQYMREMLQLCPAEGQSDGQTVQPKVGTPVNISALEMHCNVWGIAFCTLLIPNQLQCCLYCCNCGMQS